jgi:hypothetical protein
MPAFCQAFYFGLFVSTGCGVDWKEIVNAEAQRMRGDSREKTDG